MSKLKSKLESGKFVLTCEAGPPKGVDIEEELEKERIDTPVLVGILPLKSAGMARFMNKNIAGVSVPEEIINELDDAEDTVAKSIEISARIIDQTKDLCQGVHLMPMGWEKYVPEIIELAKL